MLGSQTWRPGGEVSTVSMASISYLTSQTWRPTDEASTVSVASISDLTSQTWRPADEVTTVFSVASISGLTSQTWRAEGEAFTSNTVSILDLNGSAVSVHNGTEDEDAPSHVLTPFSLAMRYFVALFILCVNIVTIVVFSQERSLRKKSNVLVISLACTDLIVGVMVQVGSIIMSFDQRSIPPEVQEITCAWRHIVYLVTCSVSIANIALIALERYLYIVRPYLHLRLVTSKSLGLVIAVLWTSLSAVYAATMAYFYSYVDDACPWPGAGGVVVHIYIPFGVFMVCSLITLVCYSLIARLAWDKRRDLRPVYPAHYYKSEQSTRQGETTPSPMPLSADTTTQKTAPDQNGLTSCEGFVSSAMPLASETTIRAEVPDVNGMTSSLKPTEELVLSAMLLTAETTIRAEVPDQNGLTSSAKPTEGLDSSAMPLSVDTLIRAEVPDQNGMTSSSKPTEELVLSAMTLAAKTTFPGAASDQHGMTSSAKSTEGLVSSAMPLAAETTIRAKVPDHTHAMTISAKPTEEFMPLTAETTSQVTPQYQNGMTSSAKPAASVAIPDPAVKGNEVTPGSLVGAPPLAVPIPQTSAYGQAPVKIHAASTASSASSEHEPSTEQSASQLTSSTELDTLVSVREESFTGQERLAEPRTAAQFSDEESSERLTDQKTPHTALADDTPMSTDEAGPTELKEHATILSDTAAPSQATPSTIQTTVLDSDRTAPDKERAASSTIAAVDSAQITVLDSAQITVLHSAQTTALESAENPPNKEKPASYNTALEAAETAPDKEKAAFSALQTAALDFAQAEPSEEHGARTSCQEACPTTRQTAPLGMMTRDEPPARDTRTTSATSATSLPAWARKPLPLAPLRDDLRRTLRALKAPVVIFGVFFVTWGPHMFTYMVHALQAPVSRNVRSIVANLAFGNSAMNFFVYLIFNSKFRGAVLRRIRCKAR